MIGPCEVVSRPSEMERLVNRDQKWIKTSEFTICGLSLNGETTNTVKL